jgi:hypothetical protein
MNKKDVVAIATTATSGVTAATGGILTWFGFTSSGIAAGSAAAISQASVGNIVAGSTFATLQSLGASGVFYGLGAAGGIGLAAGGVYGGIKLYQHFKNKNHQPKL